MLVKSKQQGFTLIELLIAIAIIGILLSIAYPSYTESIKKTRREEAKRTLLESAQVLESYYAMNVNYSGAVTAGVLTVFTVSDEFSDYYTLTAVAASSTYTVTATPKGDQADDDCGTMTLSQTGNTTAAASNCW